MEGSCASSSLRRSTARPRRILSAPMTVPTAVSMNTGAIASWITPAISGTCGSNATRRSLAEAAGRLLARVLFLLVVLLLEQLGAFLESVFQLGLRDQQYVLREKLYALGVLRLRLQ